MSDREFPILVWTTLTRAGRTSSSRDEWIPGTPLKTPWHVAELAYAGYVARYGSGGQTLERLAERGGFSPEEMDRFLPDWRSRVSDGTLIQAQRQEIATLRSRVAELERELADHEDHCRRIDAIVAASGHHVAQESADGAQAMANTIDELRADLDQARRHIQALSRIEQAARAVTMDDVRAIPALFSELRAAVFGLPSEES